MRRLRATRSGVTLLVTAMLVGAVLVACGSSDEDSGSPATTTTSATTATSTTVATEPTTTSTTPTTPTTAVHVYLVRGEHLVSVERRVPATKAVATAAVQQLLAGPTAVDERRGYATAVPGGTELRAVTIEDGLATVDLTRRFESGGGSLSMFLRLAQVVFTATQFPTATAVNFRLDGKAVTVFGGEGIMLDRPSVRAGFEDVLPAIFVDHPAAGETVHSPLRVRGTANVFEAQFSLEVMDAGGHVLATRAVTATSGTGTRGSFDVSVSLPAGLEGEGTVSVFDHSPRDGSRTLTQEVPVTFG